MQVDMQALTLACLGAFLLGCAWYGLEVLLGIFLRAFFSLEKGKVAKIIRGFCALFRILQLVLFSMSLILVQYALFDGKLRGVLLLFAFVGFIGSKMVLAGVVERRIYPTCEKVRYAWMRAVLACLSPFVRLLPLLVCKLFSPVQKACLLLKQKRAKMLLVRYEKNARARISQRAKSSLLALAEGREGINERHSYNIS